MVGKITTVLAKKEAEAYQSQGLHTEAKDLFINLLSSSPNIDPAIREAIQSQIKDIDARMQAEAERPRRPLTKEEIITMRDGWGDRASDADTLVCAQAFYQIGAYDQALMEFLKLLSNKNQLKKLYITAIADCLVHLHQPAALPAAVDQLAGNIAQSRKTALAVQVAMAKHMDAQGHADHALTLYRHLQKIPSLAAGMQTCIDALNHRS